MSKKEIAGICAFAKAVNASWPQDKLIVSPKGDFVVVSGKTEFVLKFISSVTSLFCSACVIFAIVSDDGNPVYKLF